MKRKTTILIFLSVLTLSAFPQVDYIEFKNQYSLTCAVPDSAVVVRNQILLDSIQSVEIVNGEKEYLYDFGWVYYMRYLKWSDMNDLKISASSFERGWHEFKDLSALWNLSGIYRTLGDCTKSLDLTETYLQEVPDTISVDYKQVYYRYKFCRNKE